MSQNNNNTIERVLNRRRVLEGMAATGVIATAGCLGDDDDDGDDSDGDDTDPSDDGDDGDDSEPSDDGDDGDDGEPSEDVNPFENEKFRRGMTRLIPREAVIEQIFGGNATALGGPISPGLGAYWDEEHEQGLLDEYVGEDQEAAEQLLDEAFDELGIEPPFELSFITNVNRTRERWMEVIQQTMDETEYFDAELDIQPFDELVAFLLDPEGAAQSTDVVGIGWTGGSDPNGHVEQILHSSQAVPNGFNWTLYEDDTVDQLIEDGQQELDEDARVDIYHELQEYLAQQVPSAFMWTGDRIDVVLPDSVENWQPYPNSSFRYWALYRPTVDQMATPADGSESAEFTASLGANPSTPDPTIVTDATSNSAVGTMCYESLIDLPFDLAELRPCLATDWEQVDDTTWDVDVREGVEFHTGDELTPEDVVFSVNRMAGTTNDATVSFVEEMNIDGQTVTFHTDAPHAPFLNDVGSVPILPSGPDGISENPDEDDFGFDGDSAGTGPWILEEWAPEDRVTLSRNENYWYDGEDYPVQPPWETVTLRVVPEQVNQHEAILNGELDMIDNAAPFELDIFDGEDPEVITGPAVGFDFISYPL